MHFSEILKFCFVICFIHPIFRFWFSVTFGDEVTKILRNLCLHFARQDGQDGKKRKENHATKVTQIPKTKRRRYEMNETMILIKSYGSYLFSENISVLKIFDTIILFHIKIRTLDHEVF